MTTNLAGTNIRFPVAMDCECHHRARDGTQPLWERHHSSCPLYSPVSDASAVISELLAAMEAWGSDEDGIHPEAWDAYQRDRLVLGRGLLPDSEGGTG